MEVVGTGLVVEGELLFPQHMDRAKCTAMIQHEEVSRTLTGRRFAYSFRMSELAIVAVQAYAFLICREESCVGTCKP